MPPAAAPYADWTHDALVSRVMHLESQLRARTDAANTPTSTTPEEQPQPPQQLQQEAPPPPTAKKPKAPKQFDPSRYAMRPVALKLAYLGGRYNGFEHHANNATPLTTVEEELWRALMKARLIFPSPREEWAGTARTAKPGSSSGSGSGSGEKRQHWEGQVNWTGCEYSKCGRTDRGVSAFGQVVAMRMRSNRPQKKLEAAADTGELRSEDVTEERKAEETQKPFDDIHDEINYPTMLNRILPPDIRILAWCPAPTSNFSARFSCKERRYKYFFTQPAFLPTPAADVQSAFLDVDAMREAAGYLVGAHDFRNFCKVDASKQITNFTRRVTHATIDRVSTLDTPSFFDAQAFASPGRDKARQMEVLALSLHGTAFLWHQVRCIMAVLFLVGQRLEKPEVVRDLLDMSDSAKGRPKYEMAEDAPLVLWDCIFPLRPDDDDGVPYNTGEKIQDAVPWIYTSDTFMSGANVADAAKVDGHWGRNGLMDGLWRIWRNRKMDEILGSALLDKAAGTGITASPTVSMRDSTTLVFGGGDGSRAAGKYVPIMQRERMEPVEVINARYAEKKGLTGRSVAPANDADGDE